MGKTEINKKAFELAEKELLGEKIEEVKVLIKLTLESVERKKEEKARVEEELRVLKLDLSDLRCGNFDRIKERKEKSQVARNVGIDLDEMPAQLTGVAITTTATSVDWGVATAGTYTVMSSTGANKSYYLN